MSPDYERLYRGVSHAAWAYFFLYFNINLNTLNILPDFVCYLLLWSAIGRLEGEERDLTLLRPLCVLLGVWAGADWAFALLGGTLGGRFPPVDLLVSAVAIYFHFQLFTDLARLAERYQPPGAALDRRLLRLRTVQTLILTSFAVLGWCLPNGAQLTFPGSSLPEGALSVLLIGMVLVSMIVALLLMGALFTLRQCFSAPPEEGGRQIP